MARIRSIHPSLYTDEDFMSLSLAARVVLPGLWTECDDQGLFAWKPLTLKARILPADNADMVAILAELKQARFLCSFMHDGKEYGAVRNFRKFQRPKKPTNIHHLPNELRTYVGLTVEGSPPVPHQDPPEEENHPQMEDGGDKMEEEGRKEVVAVAPAALPETSAPVPDIPKTISKPAEPEIPEFLVREPNGKRWENGRAVPPEWITEAELRRKSHSLAPVNLHLEAEKFVNYWVSKSGKDACKKDWKSTWMNRALSVEPPRGQQIHGDPEWKPLRVV